jgi:glucosamine 6-phosphate synthetase-like amidotransferase/phosphosugar isomerase protein
MIFGSYEVFMMADKRIERKKLEQALDEFRARGGKIIRISSSEFRQYKKWNSGWHLKHYAPTGT